MSRHGRVAAMGLALMLPLSAAASAADFSITVPLRLSQLPPEIDAARVGCTVRQPDSGSTRGAFVGGGFTEVRPTSGSFSGDVVVAFNASATADPSRARLYTCSLRFFGMVAGERREFVDATIYGGSEPYGSRPPRYESLSGSPRLVIPNATGAAQAHAVNGALP